MKKFVKKNLCLEKRPYIENLRYHTTSYILPISIWSSHHHHTSIIKHITLHIVTDIKKQKSDFGIGNVGWVVWAYGLGPSAIGLRPSVIGLRPWALVLRPSALGLGHKAEERNKNNKINTQPNSAFRKPTRN